MTGPTPAPRTGPALYYYANGERVPLQPALGRLAILGAVVDARGSDAAQEVLRRARLLKNGVSLADAASVPASVVEELRALGALLPIARFGEGLVAVLPEVRIEEERKDKLAAIKRWLDSARERVTFEGSLDSGRVTVLPRSGRGQDALALANEIHELLGPELAQARFLRILER